MMAKEAEKSSLGISNGPPFHVVDVPEDGEGQQRFGQEHPQSLEQVLNRQHRCPDGNTK